MEIILVPVIAVGQSFDGRKIGFSCGFWDFGVRIWPSFGWTKFLGGVYWSFSEIDGFGVS